MPYLKKVITDDDRAALTASLAVRPAHMKLTGITSPVCDFCGADNPIYMYAANYLTTGEETRCWRWAACWYCSLLVDADDWKAIETKVEQKVKAMLPINVPNSIITLSVREVLKAFHTDVIQVKEKK